MAQGDGFLFSGNRHDTVPRRLFLDERLTPLERNAWQVIRMHLDDDSVPAFPSYETLRPYLAMVPCGAKASFETIARVLTLLRLTRWLSLICRQRDPETGRKLGNLYVLHDDPLTPFEAMQLDAEYLELLCDCFEHASAVVRRVCLHVLEELAADPAIQTRLLPTRVQLLTQRLGDIQSTSTYPQETELPDSEAGRFRLPESEYGPATESEIGPKPALNQALRNPKPDSTVSSKYIYKVPTTDTNTDDLSKELKWPARFLSLQPAQQSGIKTAMAPLDAATCQALLDEWDARCHKSQIRNPSGYLFGIIQKAFRGEFNAWATTEEAQPAAVSTPSPTTDVDQPLPDLEVVETYLAQIRSMMSESAAARQLATATKETTNHPAHSNLP